MKRALQPVGSSLPRKALDGFDRASLTAHGERKAGRDCLAVQEDGARAAFSAVTSGLYPGQPCNVAQIINKKLIFSNSIFPPTSVDFNS